MKMRVTDLAHQDEIYQILMVRNAAAPRVSDHQAIGYAM
jgi:hypothetical protein